VIVEKNPCPGFTGATFAIIASCLHKRVADGSGKACCRAGCVFGQVPSRAAVL